ncbi:MAG: zinc ribbon domain-containing protein [Thermoflexales bacterium]|nr:zinc ribbon domain-containing protein [Thermoflexales bacterium]
MKKKAAAVVLIVVCALALAPWAAAQSSRAVRLATLDIAVWPEFDRPAVLVIYRGQLAAESPLPAEVSVRMPATASGGKPHAVAADDPVQGLLNVPYTSEEQGDWIQVSFTTARAAFQIEFYDELDLSRPERQYRLVWPGDAAVAHVTLQVQEPYNAADFRATPQLEAGQRREDGLMYYSAELGELEARQPLQIDIAYRKSDSRTSVEALRLTPPTPTPQPNPALTKLSAWPVWVGVGVALALLLIVAGLVWQFYAPRQEPRLEEYTPSSARRDRRQRDKRHAHAVARSKRRTPPPEGTLHVETTPAPAPVGFCTQCGQPLRAEDDFCTQCGRSN